MEHKNNIVFALDIGTRSVMGLLVENKQNSIQAIDYCMIEHDERSMRDGQIHDVIAVTNTIKKVKETLEARNNFPLHNVCIAAAGRSLKTIEASATIDLSKFPINNDKDVKHFELSALQVAQNKLATEQLQDSYSNYYCVGYSLLFYKLDGERIGSLIEQKGIEATVEIIATFLPKIVVESLLTAVANAGLNVEAMTLEPIAALHVLVPESMRRLNVVLVDIGAGTSDIAITDNNTVTSYGMVPSAGDEITEAISDSYLLDFTEAEKIKREIVNKEKAEMEDILGLKSNLTYDELVITIKEDIKKLASVIATEIQRLNKKAPRAVMLVGGGSLTPLITELLAEFLDLPTNRIAIRGIDAIQKLENKQELPAGPTFVTPIGIAITAKERPVQYRSVSVNDVQVRLFEIDKLTVGDALVQAGYEINRYYGKPGIAALITVNEKEITIPGEFGDSPVIYLNEKLTTVEAFVQDGDTIRLEKGNDGKTAELTIEELIGKPDDFQVKYNGNLYSMGTTIEVNHKSVAPSYIIQDHDVVTWNKVAYLKDFINTYLPKENLQGKLPIIVNGKQIELDRRTVKYLINDKEATLESKLTNQDELSIVPSENTTVKDLFLTLEKMYWTSIQITFNGKDIKMKQPAYQVFHSGNSLDYESILKPFDRLELKESNSAAFLFQDVFRYVELDLTNASGNFEIYCNNKKAAFHTPIQSGDQLEIIWYD